MSPRNERRSGCEPGRGGGSAEFRRRQLPRDEPAWWSGALRRREGRALGGIFQQALQESVLVLQRLNAARQIVDLSLQQLHLLGQIYQVGWGMLGTFQSAGQRPADR